MHRTLTFHLGLFPIVILLWAWADSSRNETRWQKVLSDDVSADLRLNRSAFRLETTRALQALPPGYLRKLWSDDTLGSIQRTQLSGVVANRWFLPYESTSEITRTRALNNKGWSDYEIKERTIPLWLILAIYLPLWVAISFWHSRRKTKRLQQSLPPAQPQTDLDLRV